jgi:hypothetical protein
MPEGSYAADDRTIAVAEGDLINLSCAGTTFRELPGLQEFATARSVHLQLYFLSNK